MLEKYEKEIYDSGAYVRDCKRWPESTKQNAALKLSVLKQYVSKRLEIMDAYMEQTHGAADD